MARRWKKPAERPRLASSAMLLVLVAFLMTGLGAAGARNGWLPPSEALQVVPWSCALAALGLLIALLARFRRAKRGDSIAVAAVLISLLYLGTAAGELVRQRNVAGLLDVSTDLNDPPAFTRTLRDDVHLGLAAGGRPGFAMLSADERWKALHAEAYPLLRGVVLPTAPLEALKRAQVAAGDLGWRVYHRSPSGFEAEARTRLFGLTDDIAVRVRPEEKGSRVDVRSVRREGRHDRGQGERNVLAILSRMQASSRGD